MLFERHAHRDLKLWLKRQNRKPLVIRGARQVGKSTLVRQFSSSEKLTLLECNFEILRLKSLKADLLDPEKLFLEIEAHFDQKLSSQTLLFLDEIQRQPKILPALRYFFEKKPEVPVLAAGSLLEFVLEQHEFDMPVGRIEYFHLGPLTFSEFLNARKKALLWEQVSGAYKNSRLISEAQHYQLSEMFREYIFVGGMPEAVQVFVASRDPREVRRTHINILETYKDDFPKYTTRSTLNYLNVLFEQLPQILGKKIKYSEISADYSSREMKQAIALLQLARIICCCYHTNASGLPLAAQKDARVFKIYFLDIGLYNSLIGATWQQTQDYQDSSMLTKGLLAEQFVAQHLAYRGAGLTPPDLYYWLREKKKNNAELDFVLEKDGELLPVEVKSGESGTLKSLVQFAYDKKIQKAIRLDLKYRQNLNENFRYKISDEKSGLITINLKNLHLGLVELI